MATALSKQIAPYDKMRTGLEIDFLGKWVVMYDETLIGTYESLQDAANEAVTRFGLGPYLIKQVGKPSVISLPASLLYRPVSATS